MGIIGNIRKHSWIAVLVVGIAIIAFIIGDLTKNRKQEAFAKLDGDEVTYDDTGKETMRVTLRAGTDCVAAQVPRNVYHTFIPHEDGTTIFEAKDRAYDPDSTISL